MSRLIWTPPALDDVQRLYRFLARHDETSARSAVKATRSSVKTLAHQPQVGRPVEDMDAEFREWLIDFGSSGYILLYHYDGATATILAVRHQKEAGYWHIAEQKTLIGSYPASSATSSQQLTLPTRPQAGDSSPIQSH